MIHRLEVEERREAVDARDLPPHGGGQERRVPLRSEREEHRAPGYLTEREIDRRGVPGFVDRPHEEIRNHTHHSYPGRVRLCLGDPNPRSFRVELFQEAPGEALVDQRDRQRCPIVSPLEIPARKILNPVRPEETRRDHEVSCARRLSVGLSFDCDRAPKASLSGDGAAEGDRPHSRQRSQTLRHLIEKADESFRVPGARLIERYLGDENILGLEALFEGRQIEHRPDHQARSDQQAAGESDLPGDERAPKPRRPPARQSQVAITECFPRASPSRQGRRNQARQQGGQKADTQQERIVLHRGARRPSMLERIPRVPGDG